jgi:GNAT superfamily N-acetyltransferase
MRETVRHKMGRFREVWSRRDLDRVARAIHVADLSLVAARISPVITIGQDRFYELTAAPRQFRGLRDLRVRLAGPDDTAALAALDTTPPRLIAERFARDNLAYVGELDGRMLAHSWFHRGPAPFDEDAPRLPSWHVPADAYWSYHAYTLPEARTSGVFVKLFQTALRELLVDRGAARVRCRVRVSNAASVTLHERLGFAPLGTLIALVVPGARLLSWQGGGRARSWVERRDAHRVMTFPPELAA